MISRRHILKSGGLLAACLTFPAMMKRGGKTHIIAMDSDEDGARVWFDPIGLFVQPGDKIRFIVHHNTHTVAAYHPDNEGHSLRIPHKAKPWNSGYLVEPGEHFEVTLHETGVYDYYCEPHEAAGMAGRIVVGDVSGPGAQSFDYFKQLKSQPDWQDVPRPVRCLLPDAHHIMRQKTIPFDLKRMIQKCNL